MALLTAATLSLQLGVSESNGDLTAIAAAVNEDVETYLGYDPESTSLTDKLDGTGTYYITLDCPPADRVPHTITTVHEDRERVFGADTLLTADTDYVEKKGGNQKTGVLVRLNTVWPFQMRGSVGRLATTMQPYPECVKVVYAIDNTAVLAIARMAARIEGKARYDAYTAGAGVGIVTSDSMDGASVSITLRDRPGKRPNSHDNFVSPLVADMLDPYAKIRFPR